MPAPSRPQQIEIARRVCATFSAPSRWHRSGWGRDADSREIRFGPHSFVYRFGHGNRPDLTPASPESPLCFCLAAAVRIHTGSVVHRTPRFPPDAALDAMCSVYTRCAGIGPRPHARPGPHPGWPHLEALIAWNDSPARTFEEIRDLVDAAIRSLEPGRP